MRRYTLVPHGDHFDWYSEPSRLRLFAGLLAETVVLLALLIGVPALVLLLGWQS